MEEPVVVATVRYRHEAELIHGLLESAGIMAMVASDDLGDEHPALSMVRGVRVLVGPGDVEAAKELLASRQDDIAPDDDARD